MFAKYIYRLCLERRSSTPSPHPLSILIRHLIDGRSTGLLPLPFRPSPTLVVAAPVKDLGNTKAVAPFLNKRSHSLPLLRRRNTPSIHPPLKPNFASQSFRPVCFKIDFLAASREIKFCFCFVSFLRRRWYSPLDGCFFKKFLSLLLRLPPVILFTAGFMSAF